MKKITFFVLTILTGSSLAMEQNQPMTWLTKRAIDMRSIYSQSKTYIFNYPYYFAGGIGIASLFAYQWFTKTNYAAQYTTLLAKHHGSKGKSLQYAIETNNLNLATYILAQEKSYARKILTNYTNPSDEHLHNLLVKAITLRNVAAVELLLANGANPKASVLGSINAVDYAEVLKSGNATIQEIYNKLKLAIPVAPPVVPQTPLTPGAKALLEELQKLDSVLNQ